MQDERSPAADSRKLHARRPRAGTTHCQEAPKATMAGDGVSPQEKAAPPWGEPPTVPDLDSVWSPTSVSSLTHR